MEAEMTIKSRRSVILRVDNNTSTPDGLGRATCPIHGIRQEEQTEPLSLKIRARRQPTKAGDGDLERVMPRQCGRQGFNNDKRRGEGKKPRMLAGWISCYPLPLQVVKTSSPSGTATKVREIPLL